MSYYSKYRRRARATSATTGPTSIPLVGGFASRFVAPRGPAGGVRLSTGAVRLGRTGGGQGGNASSDEIVAGPLGIYQEDKGRPFEQVGKFGSNLLQPTGYGPGAPSAYHPAVENPLKETGFWEGVLGGLGGIVGGDVGRNVLGTLGSGVDLPFEAAGNIAGLPLGFITSAPTHLSEEGLRPEFQQVYEAAIEENPLNAILYWSRVAKMQWEADVAAGRQVGFLADIGPSVNPIEQLGTAVNLLLFKPQEFVSGALSRGTGNQTETLETLEQAARTGQSGRIRNPFYAELLMRLERGDFGSPGSQQARDLMIDEIVRNNATLRDPNEENEESPIWLTSQGLTDFAYSLVTDPWILAAGIPGLVRNAAKSGWATINAKFLQQFDAALQPGIVNEITQVARRMTGVADDEAALIRLNRDPQLNYQATREVAQKYPEQFAQAEAAARYRERWAVRWEPALRPVINVVDRVNNPQRLWGKGAAGRAADTIYSTNVTEGAIRAYGLDNHAGLVDTLGARSDEVLTRFNRGLGTYTANLARVIFRNGLVKDIRRRGGVPFAHDPEDIIQQRIRGATGRDIATSVEQYNLRVKPLYLATERGGAAAALERARVEAADRLQLMGMPRDEATGLAGSMNRDQIAEIDAAYFGLATDEFVTARSAAIKAKPAKMPVGAVDPERLTILGPRQMTMQIAADVLAAVKRGETGTVREALRRYDLLFENLSEGLPDADLLRLARELLEDQIQAKALPSDLPSLNGLSTEMQQWAERNAALGYRPGFRPEEMWRVTVNDEAIVGVNPWVELVGVASDVPTYSRFDRAKDLLFHQVRGERILADARVRMAQFTTDRFGFTRGESDALFARFIRKAQEAGITPRGMSPEQIYETVRSHSIADEIRDGIGPREAIEALMVAFEGNWRHVGLTQKFTGAAKSGLGGQGNWLGQMAERIYPTVRFTLNPLFQAQELIEPYILNIMRGVKPGWRASELDEKTLGLIEDLIRQSKYAPDDQIERSDVLLWGADAARQAFGPATRLGRFTRMLAFKDRINVKEVKRVNFARATRRRLGVEFEENLNRVAPDLIPALRAQYGTGDMGEIAVRYLTEKAAWGASGREAQRAILAGAKPQTFGARAPVVLADVAHVIEEAKGSEDVLRHVISDGTLDEVDFTAQLTAVGADPDYARRAFITASASFTPDEFWAGYRDVFADGNATATRHARNTVQARAEVLGMSEHEYLARTFADIPMGTEGRALLGASKTERAAFQFMVDAADEATGRVASVNKALQAFRDRTRFAKEEHLVVLDRDGNILAEGKGEPWRVTDRGAHVDAHITAEQVERVIPHMPGNIVVHNHPSRNPYSYYDLATAVNFNVGEMIVTSPGTTWRLNPGGGFDSLKAGMEDYYGATLSDGEVTNFVVTEWEEGVRRFYDDIRSHDPARRLFGQAQSDADYFASYMDMVAQRTAIQRMADMWGWDFDSVVDFRMPSDLTRLEQYLRGFAMNPPAHLARQYPYIYGSASVARHDFGSGSQVAFEFDPGGGSRHAELFPPAYTLQPDAARAVMDEMEDWLRSELSPRFGVVATDVRRARGGWFSLDDQELFEASNAVVDLYGARADIEDWARAVGYLMQQSEVIVTRPKVGKQFADYTAGEAWALQFRASRELTDDEATRLMQEISNAAPEIGAWGSMVVRLNDGRTAVRFVRRGDVSDGRIDRVVFDNMTAPMRTTELLERMGAAVPEDVEVTMTADVMDTVFVGNNWDEVADGSGYLGPLRERRGELAVELERRLSGEATDRLAAAYRAHAPEEFAAHLDGLRAAGKPVPEFRVPGQYVPAPLGDRLTTFIPGGIHRLADVRAWDDSFSIWEQQLLKVQKLDSERLWNADPEMTAQLYSRIWNSHEKTLETPEDIYNAFAWAALTANAALDVTEGSFPLVRAYRDSFRNSGQRGLLWRVRQAVARLPMEYQDDPAALGIAFQLQEGLRLNGINLKRADWLNAEAKADLDRLLTRLDNLMNRATTQAQRERTAARLNRALGGAAASRANGGTVPQVHPFPTTAASEVYGDGWQSYVSFNRPNRIRGPGTNTAWGNVMRWLNTGLFNDTTPEVQRFLHPQLFETNSQYALRMSSILPGIDVKTGMLATLTSGPRNAGRAALDTHMLRYIALRAQERGELEDLLSQLRPGYADHIRTEVKRAASGKSAFRSPQAQRVWLLPDGMRTGPVTPEKIAAMRSRLHLIPDPETRALYDSDAVLSYVARTGGKVNVWGGDYAVLEGYLSNTLRDEEAAALRAAGHERAATFIDSISAGKYQWLLWDRIRARAGVRLDPHLGASRGANALPHRTAIELDEAVGMMRAPGLPEPYYSLSLQETDGRALGANALMDDNRRILLATQFKDSRTGMHEMAHVFEADLDPSQRNVVLGAFRAATGSKRRTWSREVSEWWADEFLSYIRSGKIAPGNRGLRGSFEYLRRQMNREYEVLQSQAASAVAEKTRNRAINTAQKKVEGTTKPASEAADVLRRAERREYRARRDLRSAKARNGVAVIEQRYGNAVEATAMADNALKEAKALVRAAREEARAARVRAEQAAGTSSAGGLTVAARRAEARIAEAEALVKPAQRNLERARAAQRRASADLRGARRRTPVEKFEEELQRARAEVESARTRSQQASTALDDAKRALNEAKAMPTKVRVKAEAPAISPEMEGLFKTLLVPADTSLPKTGKGSPVDIGTHYNLQDEAVYQAAEMALSRAEENAFTLHYYKRGRNFIERSVNHPYFGLYPASYMWGKVLPEMVRFLTRTPFGIEAPMGGAALAANIYNQVLVQQNFDEEFRREMVEKTDFFHLLALLTPSLPWEVPVNAPLWARRLAESDATYAEKVASGETDAPLMDAEQFGQLTSEMLTYAFGPANTFEMVGSGLDAAFTFGSESLQSAATSIQGALSPVSELNAPSAPIVDTQAAQQAIVRTPTPGG